jgi:hypothetical protein
MKNSFNIIAIALIVAWAIGILGFNAGRVIHTLLVIAFFIIAVRLIKKRKEI